MKFIYRIALLCILASCGSSSEEKNMEPALQSQTVTLTPAQAKNANLSFSKLEKKPISRTLQVSGKIDVPPQNMVSVSVPLGGYLKSSQRGDCRNGRPTVHSIAARLSNWACQIEVFRKGI